MHRMCVENAKEGSVCLVELHASGEEEEEDRGRGSKGVAGMGGLLPTNLPKPPR